MVTIRERDEAIKPANREGRNMRRPDSEHHIEGAFAGCRVAAKANFAVASLVRAKVFKHT